MRRSEKIQIQRIKTSKGNRAEHHVRKVIDEAIEALGKKAYVVNNLYMQFPSAYGNDYGATTEVDHIVVTGEYIFSIETKNQHYANWVNHYMNSDSDFWYLNNDDQTPVLNPIIQNYYHKLILAEKLGVAREAIIQVEVMKTVPNFSRELHEPCYGINDHILKLDDEDLEDELCMLFMSENKQYRYDFDDVVRRLRKIRDSEYLYRQNHINNLEEYRKIMKYQPSIRCFDPDYCGDKIEYTDTVYCPLCGSEMKIELFDGPVEPGKKRRKSRYVTILRCTNSRCRYMEDFDLKGVKVVRKRGTDPHLKEIPESDVKIKTIEERMGYKMPEEYQEMVLDRIKTLENAKKNLESQASWYERTIDDREKRIEALKDEAYEKNKLLNQTKSELAKFRHVMGNLYIKKT